MSGRQRKCVSECKRAHMIPITDVYYRSALIDKLHAMDGNNNNYNTYSTVDLYSMLCERCSRNVDGSNRAEQSSNSMTIMQAEELVDRLNKDVYNLKNKTHNRPGELQSSSELYGCGDCDDVWREWSCEGQLWCESNYNFE